MERFCKQCGKKLDEDTVFCPECGTKVESLETVLSETNQTSERKSHTRGEKGKRRKAITCGILLICFIVVLTVVVRSVGENTLSDKTFDEAMDAFDECYNEFLSEKSCNDIEVDAAMHLLLDEKNQPMMVIADFDEWIEDQGCEYDLYFYSYNGRKVEEKFVKKNLKITNDDTGIYFMHLDDSVYMTTEQGTFYWEKDGLKPVSYEDKEQIDYLGLEYTVDDVYDDGFESEEEFYEAFIDRYGERNLVYSMIDEEEICCISKSMVHGYLSYMKDCTVYDSLSLESSTAVYLCKEGYDNGQMTKSINEFEFVDFEDEYNKMPLYVGNDSPYYTWSSLPWLCQQREDYKFYLLEDDTIMLCLESDMDLENIPKKLYNREIVGYAYNDNVAIFPKDLSKWVDACKESLKAEAEAEEKREEEKKNSVYYVGACNEYETPIDAFYKDDDELVFYDCGEIYRMPLDENCIWKLFEDLSSYEEISDYMQELKDEEDLNGGMKVTVENGSVTAVEAGENVYGEEWDEEEWDEEECVDYY